MNVRGTNDRHPNTELAPARRRDDVTALDRAVAGDAVGKGVAPSLVWLRQDLRLSDNPALLAAADRQRPVVPVYVLDDDTAAELRIGAAGRWWLHHSLAMLAASLGAIGLPLVLRRGAAVDVIPELAAEIGADAVFWNRIYEPAAIARDTEIARTLRARGVVSAAFNAALLHEPWTLKTRQDDPFKVFTPFWQTLRRTPPAAPAPAPRHITPPERAPRSAGLSDWPLLSSLPDWAEAFHRLWTPGEAGARQRLGTFLGESLAGYESRRARPDVPATSRLSPHLHWGEISPRQVWHAVAVRAQSSRDRGTDVAATALHRQLGWREFTHHVLFHWPDLPHEPWRAKFAAFPWRDDPASLKAWQRGRTGYPMVDAGMRELCRTGWMHNRVRMIAASFLVKHLLISWQAGAAWFRDTLLDADLAQNSFNWQWVAGSGADGAPYFRIFNPVLQGRKFDPGGNYIRRWLPELARLPNDFVHQPWAAPNGILKAAGVTLGAEYPLPLVQHAAARDRALAAFKSLATPAAARIVGNDLA